MIIEALHQVANHRESLSREAAREVMSEILSGGATDAQIAAFLVALHMKGETVEEIVGFAEAIRKASAPLAIRDSALDVSVAKHGNRSVSSRCGSADVVEALGINITLPPARVAECLEAVGIAFLFAPSMHSAMKYVQPARRELRLRTVFNLLGPLCNPANASAQIVGVYSSALVEKLARALQMLGLKRALVVHGKDGLDEITITGPTHIAEVRNGEIRAYDISPEEFGLRSAPISEIQGGDTKANAEIIRKIVAGERSARRDVVLLNAAAALVVAGRADSIASAMPIAAESLDSGAAREKLEKLAEFTSGKRM